MIVLIGAMSLIQNPIWAIGECLAQEVAHWGALPVSMACNLYVEILTTSIDGHRKDCLPGITHTAYLTLSAWNVFSVAAMIIAAIKALFMLVLQPFKHLWTKHFLTRLFKLDMATATITTDSAKMVSVFQIKISIGADGGVLLMLTLIQRWCVTIFTLRQIA